MNKNILLGSTALILAITGAYATTIFVVPTYVRSTNSIANPCNLIGNYCDGTGGQLCSIQVFDASDNALVTKVGYRQGCVVTLQHSTSATIIPPTVITVP